MGDKRADQLQVQGISEQLQGISEQIREVKVQASIRQAPEFEAPALPPELAPPVFEMPHAPPSPTMMQIEATRSAPTMSEHTMTLKLPKTLQVPGATDPPLSSRSEASQASQRSGRSASSRLP